MRHAQRIRAATLTTLCVIAGGTIARAQGGGERLQPAIEATVRYAVEAEIHVADEPMRTYRAVVGLTWADLDAAPAMAIATVESFEATIGEGDDALTISAHRGEGESEVNAPDDFDQGDIATVGRLLAAPTRMVIDEEGRVQAARSGTMRMMIGAGVTPPSDAVLGPLSSEQIGRTLEPVFSADSAPDGAKGNWETSRAWPLGPSRTVTLIGSWTGEPVNEDDFAWRGVYTIELEKAPDASPIAPQVSVESFEGDVRAEWSAADALLNSRIERLTYEAVWTIGDIEQRVAVHSTITLRRLAGQAPGADDAESD
jgi:hypothetical protein